MLFNTIHSVVGAILPVSQFTPPSKLHQGGGSTTVWYKSPNSSSSEEIVIPILLVLLVAFLALLVWRYARARQEVEKTKWNAIVQLADRGAIDSAQVNQLLPKPRRTATSRLWTGIVVLCWFALIAGAACFVLAGLTHSRSAFDELIVGGCVLCGASVSILAVPLMLREMRRQGVA